MKAIVLAFFICWAFQSNAQQVIPIPAVPAEKNMNWKGSEQEQKSKLAGHIVYNVSAPTLTAYIPEPSIATGTALVIAPGGGFHFLTIDNEGIDLAQWCIKHGIAAFVLKYRLVPTGDDPVQEFFAKVQKNQHEMDLANAPYVKLAVEDGLSAISYLRENAVKYNINPDKIGIIGFSAGGAVAAGAALETDSKKNQPNFAAPIYPALHVLDGQSKLNKEIPTFIVVTSDDFFKFNILCADFYKRCNQAGVPTELHIYEKGGHGFGMRKQSLPSDEWVNAFGSWMKSHGF